MSQKRTLVRRRSWAVALCTLFVMMSTHCVGDFVGTPKSGVTAPPPAPPPPPPPPTARRLVFGTPPADAVAGASIGTGIQVLVEDSAGNTVTAAASNVTIGITGGTGTAGAHLRGTSTVAAVSGVATFTDLSVDSVGSAYTLTATASGLSDATSGNFRIRAGPRSQLVFIQQPTSVVPKQTMTPAVEIGTVDSLGNAVSGTLIVNLVMSAPVPGVSMSGGGPRGTQNGIATYGNLKFNRSVAGPVTLQASAEGLPTVTSGAFTVGQSSGVAGLAFIVQPVTGMPGQTMQPAIKVDAIDSLGNTVPSATNTISISIVPGSGNVAAHLAGTINVAAVGGEATFADLSIDSAGAAYRFLATSPGLTADTSTVFDMVATGPPPAAAVTVTPGNTNLTAFGATQQLQADARDAGGHTITGAPITWTTSNAAIATVGAAGLVT
ncbi:MAG TPA: hypothetical protein VGI92_10715, partial [Gemmatimonadales bacterium]